MAAGPLKNLTIPLVASIVLFILVVTHFLIGTALPLSRLGIVLYAGLGSGLIVVIILAFWHLSRFSQGVTIFPKQLEDIGGYDIIVKETNCELVLNDDKGETAHYSKTKMIIANRNGILHYTENGIWFDGSYENIVIHCDDISHYDLNSIREDRNYFDLNIHFNHPLRKHEQKSINMSWIIKDSFRNNMEFFTTTFNNPIRRYHLTIVFPNTRPVKDAWVNFTYMDKNITITDRSLIIDPGHLRVDFDLSYARPGMKSILFWEW